MRLGDESSSMPWAELRHKALAGDLDLDRSHARNRGQQADNDLDVRHLVFALRWAAREAVLPSLNPDRYRVIRRELLRRERRLNRGLTEHQSLLPQLLPSAGQIERIAEHHDEGRDDEDVAGSAPLVEALEIPADAATDEKAERVGAWDRALQLAGLEPRSALEAVRQKTRRKGPEWNDPRLPLVELIHHFLEANGEMPSRVRHYDFARELGIAVEVPSKDWLDHLEDARAYRAELGLDSPGNPRARGKGARKQLKLPADGIPGAPLRLERKGRTRYSEEDCIESLRRFDAELPPREPRTRARYLPFSVDHGTVPPSHFDRYGGFRKLMEEARDQPH